MIPKLLVLSCLAAVTLPACGGMSIRPAGTSVAVDDATISARVKTTLLNDPQVGALEIDVTTSNGVVTMSGTVKSQAEAERAIQLARQTNGVKDVISHLKPQT